MTTRPAVLFAALVLTPCPTPASAGDGSPPPKVDRYGDPLPVGAVARLGTIRFRLNSGYFFPQSLSHDGKWLATIASDGIQVTDLATGTPVRVFHDGKGRCFWELALSPDGGILADSSCGEHNDWALHVWDVRRGIFLWRARLSDGLGSRPAFTPDGTAVAVVEPDGVLRLRGAKTGDVLREQRLRGGAPRRELSDDGKVLAEQLEDGAIQLWEVSSGKQLRKFLFPDSKTRGKYCLSRDGAVVALDRSSADGYTVVDMASGKERQVVPKRKVKRPPATGATRPSNPRLWKVSPDGAWLLTVIGDRGDQLWDAFTGEPVREFVDEAGVVCCSFSPDSHLLALLTDREIVLWDLRRRRPRWIRERIPSRGFRQLSSVAFSGDGATLIVGDEQLLRVWDVASGEERRSPPGHVAEVENLSFSGDGRRVATAGDRSIRVWDAATGKLIRQWAGPDKYVATVALSADGRMLAAHGAPGSEDVHVWDVDSGREQYRFKHEVEKIPRLNGLPSVEICGRPLAFRPGGSGLLSAGTGIQLRSTAEGVVRSTLATELHVDRLTPSPDGRTVVCDGGNGSVHLLNLPTGEHRDLPVSFQKAWRLSFSFSPDGRLLAVVEDHTVSVREVTSDQTVFRFGRPGPIDAAGFSPFGRLLAVEAVKEVSSKDRRALQLWDATTGEKLQRFEVSPRDDWLGHVFLAPDGLRAAVVPDDTTALIWDLRRFAAPAAVPRRELGPGEADRLWDELAGGDAAKAFRALLTLRADPEGAVALLRNRLRQPGDEKRWTKLVADLDAPDFTVREAAVGELRRYGYHAEPALRAALDKNPSPEFAKRARSLLQRIDYGAPEHLRGSRTLHLLEGLGNPAAAEVLRTLADGEASGWLTREAKASLARLAKRPAAQP